MGVYASKILFLTKQKSEIFEKKKQIGHSTSWNK